MKIAVVIGTFPPHLGGMGAVAYKEASELAERGHRVEVFTLKYPGANYENDQLQGFSINRLRALFKFGDAGLVPQLAWQLENFDIIHFHYPFYGAILGTLSAVIFKKQKLVVTYHMDAKSRGLKRVLQKICNWFCESGFLNIASKILVVSSLVLQNSKILKTINVKNPDKIKILPNAIDLENFYPWPEEMNKIKPQGEKVILFVGNLLPVKRLDLLLEAFKDLKDVKLLVVGGGYDFDRYKKMAQKYGVLDKISFEGAVRDPRLLNNYYNLADLVVVPSDYESFSLVALEALASGAPVLVSSGVGLSNEIFTAGVGEIFATKDKNDLVNKIKQIFSNSEIKNSEAIAKRVNFSKFYGWKDHVDILEKIFEEVFRK